MPSKETSTNPLFKRAQSDIRIATTFDLQKNVTLSLPTGRQARPKGGTVEALSELQIYSSFKRDFD